MKWMMWAVLVLFGALVGIWLFRYWQKNHDAIPSVFREAVEDESMAQAS